MSKKRSSLKKTEKSKKDHAQNATINAHPNPNTAIKHAAANRGK